MTLANNHIYNYRRKAFDLRQKLLFDTGIAWLGINTKELILEKDGNRIAYTSFFCYSTNPL